jgi:hypothetical protein
MKKSQIKKTIKEEIISLLTENEGEGENILVIRDPWIRRADNPWIPIETFRGGDQCIFVYMFKHVGIIYDITGELLPLFTEFGGYKSTYIGGEVIKLKLNNPNIKVIPRDINVKETTMVDKDTDPNDVEGLNPNTVKSAVELSKKSSKPVTIAEEDDDWYNEDNEFDVDEKEPTAKDLKKEPITKIASKLAETQKEMKSIVAKYKVASDAEKPKYVERLKQLTKIKKELEKLL